MKNAVEELTEILREVGVRPTLDYARNFTLPCACCGSRGPVPAKDLVVVGTFVRRATEAEVQSGTWVDTCERGDAIARPVCACCRDVPPFGTKCPQCRGDGWLMGREGPYLCRPCGATGEAAA